MKWLVLISLFPISILAAPQTMSAPAEPVTPGKRKAPGILPIARHFTFPAKPSLPYRHESLPVLSDPDKALPHDMTIKWSGTKMKVRIPL